MWCPRGDFPYRRMRNPHGGVGVRQADTGGRHHGTGLHRGALRAGHAGRGGGLSCPTRRREGGADESGRVRAHPQACNRGCWWYRTHTIGRRGQRSATAAGRCRGRRPACTAARRPDGSPGGPVDRRRAALRRVRPAPDRVGQDEHHRDHDHRHRTTDRVRDGADDGRHPQDVGPGGRGRAAEVGHRAGPVVVSQDRRRQPVAPRPGRPDVGGDRLAVSQGRAPGLEDPEREDALVGSQPVARQLPRGRPAHSSTTTSSRAGRRCSSSASRKAFIFPQAAPTVSEPSMTCAWPACTAPSSW